MNQVLEEFLSNHPGRDFVFVAKEVLSRSDGDADAFRWATSSLY